MGMDILDISLTSKTKKSLVRPLIIFYSFLRSCIMRHIIILLFIVLLGQGINASDKKERISFLQNGWCIDTNDVLAWTLVDQNGNLYGYTAEELYNIPDSTFKKMQKYMRVKQVVFRDVDFKDDIEKD